MCHLLNYLALFPHFTLMELILIALKVSIVFLNATKGLTVSTEIRGIFLEAEVEFSNRPCCIDQFRALNC
jgi:hypothetical protein